MLDGQGMELRAGDLVEYADGRNRFQFGTITSIGPSLRGDFGAQLALVALFNNVSAEGRQWHTNVYNGVALLRKIAPSVRVDWLLTLMPELSETHDRAGADRLIQDLAALT